LNNGKQMQFVINLLYCCIVIIAVLIIGIVIYNYPAAAGNSAATASAADVQTTVQLSAASASATPGAASEFDDSKINSTLIANGATDKEIQNSSESKKVIAVYGAVKWYQYKSMYHIGTDSAAECSVDNATRSGLVDSYQKGDFSSIVGEINSLTSECQLSVTDNYEISSLYMDALNSVDLESASAEEIADTLSSRRSFIAPIADLRDYGTKKMSKMIQDQDSYPVPSGDITNVTVSYYDTFPEDFPGTIDITASYDYLVKVGFTGGDGNGYNAWLVSNGYVRSLIGVYPTNDSVKEGLPTIRETMSLYN
jgi:Tfp pilus assembly major pilin PilA